MTLAISYSEACADPNLFGPWFKGPTWARWRVLDKALFGEKLTGPEVAIFSELVGHNQPPTEPVSEAWLIMGRRSGKDTKAASIVVYLSTLGNELFRFTDRLVPGERGVVQLLALDRDQARVALSYVKAFLDIPMLAPMVQRLTADGVDLTNGLSIEIVTNDQRRVRGRTVVAAVLDEVAHWKQDNTSTPDTEVYRAIKPSMATMASAAGAMLLGISSPHARRGLLWNKFRHNFGKPGRTLVARGATWEMNPTISRDSDFVREVYADDPAFADADLGAQFRTDVEAFVSREVVEACIEPGARERPPVAGVQYTGFADPSGGAADSFTAAVAHKDGDAVVVDAVREIRPPFSPDAATEELAGFFKSYGISSVRGDKYAGLWPAERFQKHGIKYEPTARPKSELYRELLAPLNSGKIGLLDNDRLVAQLLSLERRTARGTGRDVIDHPAGPGARDDLINAVAGVVGSVKGGSNYAEAMMRAVGGDPKDQDGPNYATRQLYASLRSPLGTW